MSRSPNYPALGLTKALDAANKLWQAEKRSPFSAQSAATALGFKSLSGPARTSIGALNQYGFLEKADKGNMRLTALAISVIAHPDGSQERQDGLRTAGQTPKLFKELLQTYADASDANIKAFLITKKDFSEEGASKVIKSFRDTMRLAKLGKTELNSQDEDDRLDDSEDDFEANDRDDDRKKKRKPPRPDENVEELNFKLAPDSNVSLVFTSKEPVTQEDFDLLMEMLTLQKRAFPKAKDFFEELDEMIAKDEEVDAASANSSN